MRRFVLRLRDRTMKRYYGKRRRDVAGRQLYVAAKGSK